MYKHFENFILFLIVLSSLKLVFDTYLPREPKTSSEVQLQFISEMFDFAFNGLFAIEMCLKIITYGLVVDEDTYLRDTWN
jgi:hypothetical protein